MIFGFIEVTPVELNTNSGEWVGQHKTSMRTDDIVSFSQRDYGTFIVLQDNNLAVKEPYDVIKGLMIVSMDPMAHE